MNLRVKKTIAAAAIVLTAGTTLAACGSDDSSSAKGDSSSAGEKASKTLTKDNFFTELSKAQQDAKTSHVEMSLDAGGQKMTASGDAVAGKNAKDSAAALTMSMGTQGTFDIRLVDGVMYMNMGQVTQNKFAKIDLSDKSNPLSKQFAGILDNVDPAKQLEQMQDAITSFEQKGSPEKIDGVEATPYKVAVDSKKIIDQLGEAGAAAASQMPDQVEYTIYVGPDNLMRRLTTDIAGAKTVVNYSKWGEKVSVEAPSADQISDKDLFDMGAGMS